MYNLRNPKYLYTNGTYGHGVDGLEGLNLRNDRDFYIDTILKNRDRDYEALFKQHQQRQWKDHYK